MTQGSEVPETTTRPTHGSGDVQPKRDRFDEVMYQRNLFMTMLLDMTWQLALVVIVPIVGGYVLDQHYHKTPILTIGGFVVAGIGVFGVLSRIVMQAGDRSGYSDKPKEKS